MNANRREFLTGVALSAGAGLYSGTALAKAGYIAVEGGEKNRYSPDKRYKLLRKGKAVVRA